MKNEFVADGEQRWRAGQTAKRLQAVREKYADEWAEANFLKRIWLRFQIWCDAENQKPEAHKPSPETLW